VKARNRSLCGVIPVAVVGVMATFGAPGAQGSGDELVGKRYDSISVVRNGEPHELVKETRIRVRFEGRDDYDVVGWRAGCNRFGAPVKIRPRRLLTGQITGTEVGCSDALLRQDRWLVRFFGRDPGWAVRARRLKLRSGDDVIRLRRRAVCRAPHRATRVDGSEVRAGPFVGLIHPEYDVVNGRFRLHVGPYRDRTVGLSQKILWRVSRQADVGRRLRIHARRLSPLSHRTFRRKLRRAGGDEKQWNFPSIINPPAEGCWRLRFTSGNTTGRLVVLVRD
jgi:heat shock protein HslJ